MLKTREIDWQYIKQIKSKVWRRRERDGYKKEKLETVTETERKGIRENMNNSRE